MMTVYKILFDLITYTFIAIICSSCFFNHKAPPSGLQKL